MAVLGGFRLLKLTKPQQRVLGRVARAERRGVACEFAGSDGGVVLRLTAKRLLTFEYRHRTTRRGLPTAVYMPRSTAHGRALADADAWPDDGMHA